MSFEPLSRGERLTAKRLNRLVLSSGSQSPGRGIATNGSRGNQIISALERAGLDPERPLLARNVGESSGDYLPPFSLCAVTGLRAETEQGILNPILSVRKPTAEDIENGALVAVVQNAGLNWNGSSIGRVVLSGQSVVRVSGNESDGKRIALTEGQQFGTIGESGDWLLVAAEDTGGTGERLAFATFAPQGGDSVPVPLTIRILGGQFTTEGLPIMRYSKTEIKPATPPAEAIKAALSFTVAAGEVTAATIDIAGAGFTGDEPTVYDIIGDGTGAQVTVTFNAGAVNGATVTAPGSGYTTADNLEIEPQGLVDTVELPNGYGVGIDSNGNRRIISHWRTQTPIWDIPGSQITEETGGFWLLIKDQVTETAEDSATFPAVIVEGR